MKKTFACRFIPALLSAAIVSASLPALADGGEQAAYIHCAAYYDNDGRLVGARKINGSLSAEEVDTLVNLYEPDNAQKAKVFEWTQDLKPLGDSGKEINISNDADVVILHTNDMHGSLVGSSSVIGSDSVAALKKLDGAILADGGDASQGVALASQSKGEDVITIMNAAGYDVMAAGNHEFDYGLEQFAKLRSMADFPIISANTYKEDSLLCADGGENNGANVIIEKNGVNVGIFALTTRNTMTATKPENLTGVEFKDEIETAKEQTSALEEQGADVIIALTHMGETDLGACTSIELAEAMADTELDAIIDGHTHHVVNKKVGDITIAQTGTGSVNVGRMEITLDENNDVSVKETMLSKAFFDNITPDADVTAVIDGVSAELNETLKEEIGETKTTLWGGSIRGVIAEGRAGETNFGSLISDAMIEEAKKIVPASYKNLPIVAIENGGGYRSSVPNGKITLGHIINALPFANAVRIKEITPAILYAALEEYLSSVTAQDETTGFLTANYSGSFPQVGGMKIRYNPNKPAGEKIETVSLANNTDLDRNDTAKKLILVSNDYVTELEPFKDIPMIAEGGGLTEVVIDYVKSLTENGTKPLAMPVTTDRIITTAHNPDNYTYTAHIELTNAAALNDGDTLKVYVDGEPYETAGVVRDEVVTHTVSGGAEEGSEEKISVKALNIELPDGPHAIKLYEEQEEAYVNNYSGNGVLYFYGNLTLKYPELEYGAAKAAEPVG